MLCVNSAIPYEGNVVWLSDYLFGENESQLLPQLVLMAFWITGSFVEPTMGKPFKSSGSPSPPDSNSIVVMDNASIHHSEKVSDLVASVGALLIYLPPYSPDLNPIEEAFWSVKAFLKAHEAFVHSSRDIETILQASFDNITTDECEGWISDSGYIQTA